MAALDAAAFRRTMADEIAADAEDDHVQAGEGNFVPAVLLLPGPGVSDCRKLRFRHFFLSYIYAFYF